MLAPTLFSRLTNQPLSNLRREVDDVFEQFFGNEWQTVSFGLPVTVWEDDKHIYVELDAAGIRQDEFEVTLHQGILRIAGERKAPEEGRSYLYNERRYGRFERSLTLPDAVDPDSIEARFREGVLHIRLTKTPEAQPKRIAVKAR